MCLYERAGLYEDVWGEKIACCNIKRFAYMQNYDQVADFERSVADQDLEVLTDRSFKQKFGFKFD